MATYQNTRKGQDGFSLIELSIVLIISGVIMVALFGAASVYFERIRNEKIVRLENNVYKVMDKFVQRAGRYPCPASRTAFGDGGENCGVPTVSGARAVFAAASNDNVAVGVLPEYGVVDGVRLYLKELIDKDEPLQTDFIDPWGNRLTYAVTVGLTNPVTFNELNGTIAVVDENNNPTDGIDRNAHYVVISHGSDEIGSVTREGVLNAAGCGTASELEAPNCKLTSSRFISGLIMKGDTTATVGAVTGRMYFNDYVFSNHYFQSSLWVVKPESGTTRVNLSTSAAARVGIGKTNPADVLDVGDGTVRADRALVLSAQANDDPNKTGLVCTKVGTADEKCLNPASLFDLRCPNGTTYKYITRTQIVNNRLTAVCDDFKITPPTDPDSDWQAQCPSGLIVGIYSDGSILCTGSAGKVAPSKL